MKKINFLIIGILLIIMIFGSCTVVVNRWAIDWNDVFSRPSPGVLIIHNQTGETIDSIKYYVGDNPPSNWSNVTNTLNVTVNPGANANFTVGALPGANIYCSPNDSVWIRVAAENAWNSSKLYATNGFTYESADSWNATVYKE